MGRPPYGAGLAPRASPAIKALLSQFAEIAGQAGVTFCRPAGHSRGTHATMITGSLGAYEDTAAGDGGGTPPPSAGGELAAFARRKPFWADPGCQCWVRPLTVMVRGRYMGCVWQSDYAPEPRSADARTHHRAPARHRKPSLLRRAATA